MAKALRNRFATLGGALEAFRADFEAVRVTRFNRKRRGIPAGGAGADWHYRNESDYLKMGEYARDIDRNDMCIGALLDRAVTNQIQDGFAVNPDSGDEQLDKDLKDRWLAEKDDPRAIDHEEQKTFADIEYLTVRDADAVGDVFAIFTDEGKIQIREQHRCRSPRQTKRHVVHGIELFPDSRRRKSYWFTKTDIDAFTPKSDIAMSDLTEVPSTDMDGNQVVAHIMDPKRLSQTRGITVLAPIFGAAGMLDDIVFATLLQRQMASAFGWIENKTGEFDPTAESPDDVETSYDTSTGITVQDVRPGMIVRPPKGVRLESFNANVPGDNYIDFVRSILTIICINLGLPLVMAFMDASDTNFSGWRGAVDQARIGFRRRQRLRKTQLHMPYWRHKVRYWAEDDMALRKKIAQLVKNPRAKINPFRHDWHAPAFPYIQPQEDATANMIRLATGQISRRRLDAENGLNAEQFEALYDRYSENRKAAELAMSLNEEFGFEEHQKNYFTWRDLGVSPLPDQIRINISQSSSSQTGNDNAQPAK